MSCRCSRLTHHRRIRVRRHLRHLRLHLSGSTLARTTALRTALGRQRRIYAEFECVEWAGLSSEKFRALTLSAATHSQNARTRGSLRLRGSRRRRALFLLLRRVVLIVRSFASRCVGDLTRTGFALRIERVRFRARTGKQSANLSTTWSARHDRLFLWTRVQFMISSPLLPHEKVRLCRVVDWLCEIHARWMCVRPTGRPLIGVVTVAMK